MSTMERSLLEKLFLQRVPVPVIMKELRLSELTLDEAWQTEFLASTVRHPLATRHPPSVRHRTALLKAVSKEIERRGGEVIEDLMEALGMSMAEQESGFGYITYTTPRSCVSILESDLLVSDGTTGLQTWSASLRLTEYFMKNPDLLRGKRVLELGSGLGLMGLLLSSACQPDFFTFSDTHPTVLGKLATNITENHDSCSNLDCQKSERSKNNVKNSSEEADNIKSDKILEKRGGGCHGDEWHWLPWRCSECGQDMCEKRLRSLNWERISDADLESSNYDVVVAADVIFEKHQHFLNAVRRMYDVIPHVTTYVSNTVRRPESIQAFKDGIDSMNLKRRELEMPGPESLYWPADHVHVLYKISR